MMRKVALPFLTLTTLITQNAASELVPCIFEGSAYIPTVLILSNIGSILECKERCKRSRTCVYITLVPSKKECSFSQRDAVRYSVAGAFGGSITCPQRPECSTLHSAFSPTMRNVPIRFAENVGQCQQKCAGVDGCIHFSFSLVTGACSLHDSSAEALHSLNSISGAPTCAALGCTTSSSHYFPEMPGGEKMFLDGAYECQLRCRSVQGCQHYSYWLEDGHCTLHNASSKRLPGTWVISGPPYCPACSTYGARYLPSLPQHRKWVDDAVDCQKFCADTPGCVHFAFWPHADGRCILQGADVFMTNERDVVSGPKICNESSRAVANHGRNKKRNRQTSWFDWMLKQWTRISTMHMLLALLVFTCMSVVGCVLCMSCSAKPLQARDAAASSGSTDSSQVSHPAQLTGYAYSPYAYSSYAYAPPAMGVVPTASWVRPTQTGCGAPNFQHQQMHPALQARYERVADQYLG